MKTRFLLSIFTAVLLFVFISSCKKDAEIKISKNGETESHNMGQACTNCHKSGGSGEGIFTIAGTVYDSTLVNPLPNGKIEFYDAAVGGNLMLTLEVDGNGNFYTTNNVSFGSGLYPRAVSPMGDIHEMLVPFSGGSCASCHGNTRPRVWTHE